MPVKSATINIGTETVESDDIPMPGQEATTEILEKIVVIEDDYEASQTVKVKVKFIKGGNIINVTGANFNSSTKEVEISLGVI